MEPSLGETLKDAGKYPCGLCPAWVEQAELTKVEVDAPGHWVEVCPECRMNLEEQA